MTMRLPTGISTFRTIREGGYGYVDKTPWAQKLANGGGRYFLSRPRRFGKSLFLDMLGELFQGSEDLFEGLAIHPHWDWKKCHPVVRLSFGKGSFRTPELLAGSAMARLDEVERRTGVASSKDTAPERLAELLEFLHDETGHRAVVLVDEYDKPILDVLPKSRELARANREFLRDLYGTIKGSDEHIRFVFLTGVSRFSKVNLFSGLNNLRDLTLAPAYSAVCGYTEADLDETFGEEMAGLDRDLVREWYNGYSWLGDEKVYNPYDVLQLLEEREFRPWWYESGTPAFLVEMLTERGIPSQALEGMTVREHRLHAFDVDDIAHEALLFQTGYLTIDGVEGAVGDPVFRLGFPNREVRLSFNRSLAVHLTKGVSEQGQFVGRVRPLLEANDFDGVERHFRSFLAAVPHQWYTRTAIAGFEGHYASVLYAYLEGENLNVTAEDSSEAGRLDLAVRHAGQIYLIEFKMVPPAKKGAALEQIKARGYADKYRRFGEPIHLIGMEFSAEERNLVGFEVESI